MIRRQPVGPIRNLAPRWSATRLWWADSKQENSVLLELSGTLINAEKEKVNCPTKIDVDMLYPKQ